MRKFKSNSNYKEKTMKTPVDFEKLKELIVAVMAAHQSAVSKHGHKKVFGLLKKNPTYGFNEMNAAILMEQLDWLANSDPSAEKPRQPAKLGVVDFIIGMVETGDFAPLVLIAQFLNMACFEIPGSGVGEKADRECILGLLREINREHYESSDQVMLRLDDGEFCSDDARAISRESYELGCAAFAMKRFADDRIDA